MNKPLRLALPLFAAVLATASFYLERRAPRVRTALPAAEFQDLRDAVGDGGKARWTVAADDEARRRMKKYGVDFGLLLGNDRAHNLLFDEKTALVEVDAPSDEYYARNALLVFVRDRDGECFVVKLSAGKVDGGVAKCSFGDAAPAVEPGSMVFEVGSEEARSRMEKYGVSPGIVLANDPDRVVQFDDKTESVRFSAPDDRDYPRNMLFVFVKDRAGQESFVKLSQGAVIGSGKVIKQAPVRDGATEERLDEFKKRLDGVRSPF